MSDEKQEMTRKVTLGHDEHAGVSTVCDGTVELGEMSSVHFDFVLFFGILSGLENGNKQGPNKQTFLIVGRETPVRASSLWSMIHSWNEDRK